MPKGNRNCEFCGYNDKGECHRFPPHVTTIYNKYDGVHEEQCFFPAVQPDDYCHEFKEIDDYIRESCEHEWVADMREDFTLGSKCSKCGLLGDEDNLEQI